MLETYTPPSSSVPFHISISEILKATNNFAESSLIGAGGFGQVYKGQLSDGTIVAIKRFNPNSRVGTPESWPDVDTLTLTHPNLVSLIGYCNDHVPKQEGSFRLIFPCSNPPPVGKEKEMILVYEYMPNGSLDDHLHHCTPPLSWHQRLNIGIGVALGLRYLHDARPAVLHADVRSSNVLLDHNWAPKLSDFGLSKLGLTDTTPVVTFPKGTFGYMDPHFLASGMLTAKSDVYSFGVLLLEILSGRRAVIDDDKPSLVTWVRDSVKDKTSQKDLVDIIDLDIRNEISPKCLNVFFETAERCLLENPKQRPTMAEVVTTLESALLLQETFSSHSTPSVNEYSFDDLEIATRGFSQDLLIGEGGYGNVFRGWVAPFGKDVGTPIAVKRITSQIPQTYHEWMDEVGFLGQVAHPNIIRFLGCCYKSEHEHLLVYEYMEKSLSQFIHGDHGLNPLSWGKRLQIMIGVARGLTYLYTTKGSLCHFTCNDILLDEDFNAKIGGFGWVKIQERHDRMPLKSTFGYLTADYGISTGRLLTKSDICCFGLVLLETITGRPLANFDDVLDGLESLEMRAPKSKSNRRKVKKMMDPRLKDSYSPDGAFKCMALALRCIAIQPEYRPSREEIVWSMEQIYALNK